MILPERLTEEPYGIAFKKSKGAHTFKNYVNMILKGIKEDGTLRKIKYKWGIS